MRWSADGEKSIAKSISAGLLLALPIAFAASSSNAAPAPAVKFRTIYKFSGRDGANPTSPPVLGNSGELYVAATGGGKLSACSVVPSWFKGCGTVLRLDPPATAHALWTRTSSYVFQGGADGRFPTGLRFLDDSGLLYGVSDYGGLHRCSYGCGAVFQLAPPTPPATQWTKTILHSFTGGSDGMYPNVPLAMDAAGALYGMTPNGGGPLPEGSDCFDVRTGCGVIYKLNPPSQPGNDWGENILYRFTGGADGAGPGDAALRIGAAGAVLGITYGGGANDTCSVFYQTGCGVFFSLTKHRGGWKLKALYTFTGGNGGAGPIDDDSLTSDGSGALYGTSTDGGLGFGTVFKLVPPDANHPTWRQQVLYRFQGGDDGRYPVGGVVFGSSGSALYGTTFYGGSSTNCNSIGCGTLFKLTPPESGTGLWTKTILHQFTGTDGAQPHSLAVPAGDGKLYGMAEFGGSMKCNGDLTYQPGCGTVFQYVP